MKKMWAGLFAFTLCLAFSSNPSGDAERAEQIFIQLLTNPEKGQNHTLQEADLNAYLFRELTRQPLRGIEKLSVKMEDGTFTTFLTVNFDEVELSGYLSYLASVLDGPQRLTLQGMLEVNEGVGTYRTQAAWLNDVPLPGSLVDVLLSALGRQQEPPFDPTAPFEAPFDISQLVIQPGKAILSK